MHILATRRTNLLRKLAALGLALVFLALTASDASAQFRRGRGGFNRGGFNRGFYGRGIGGGFYRPQFYNRGFVGGNFGPQFYSRGYGGVYRAPYAQPFVAPRMSGGMGFGGGMPY